MKLKRPDWMGAKKQNNCNRNLRPIVFELKKLNKHEINYMITEKKCLAIIFSYNINK
ncbi:12156_t:CDS:2 [Cetraspora pellucida]|uniref:12156_t:CDS:1 n=1 Tax=Cetraspora pellucida TaxID=1433469 RepID=A0A9N8W685_9GLOM|nr:12156_t:CDS:2 [Cetraspora pellucida]